MLCSNCQQNTTHTIQLDCDHPLCLRCLQTHLEAVQKNQFLQDQLEIYCQFCGYQTILALPLAYKLVRPLRKQSPGKHCGYMACLDCMELFPLQEYINGSHQGHKVEPVQHTYSLFQQLMSTAGKQLQGTIDGWYKKIQRSSHNRNMLSDVCVSNTAKIRSGFEMIRKQLQRKQVQIIQQYQHIIARHFETIDQDIFDIRKKIDEARAHYLKISDWVGQSQKIQLGISNLQMVRYFVQNKDTITKFTVGQQSTYMAYQSQNYKQIIHNYRDSINMQAVKDVIDAIRNMQMINGKSCRSTVQTQMSLNREYFQAKRRDVLKQCQCSQMTATTKPKNIMKIGSYLKKQTKKPFVSLRKNIYV